ncbi:hypothetical protein HDU81_005539 [Chytriomyces hyalinus]|nr:hypothetical protein HDU81_005539 [Chytriomyces hyalinus]
MQFVIVGAGLVGASLAVALAQDGHDCVLYDRFDMVDAAVQAEGGDVTVSFGDVGGHVMIQTNGLRILKRMGILQQVLEAGLISPTVCTSKMDGTKPLRVNMFVEGEDDDIKNPVQILRTLLHSILMKACEGVGARCYTGKKLISFTQNPDSVECRFEDGFVVHGDFLIGADGVHSATRKLLFGQDKVAQFTGVVGYLGCVDLKVNNLNVDHPTTFHVDRLTKCEVVMFRVSEDKLAWRVTEYAEPDKEATDSWRAYSNLPKESERLANMVEKWGLPPMYVECIRKSYRITPVTIYDLPDIPKFCDGRVLLIGDAAHGMRPNFGQGLSLGLEDVGTLRELFKMFPEPTDYKKVFDLYEKTRIPRTHNIAGRSRGMAATVYADSPMGAHLSHFKTRLFYLSMNLGLIPHPNAFNYEHVLAAAVKEV